MTTVRFPWNEEEIVIYSPEWLNQCFTANSKHMTDSVFIQQQRQNSGITGLHRCNIPDVVCNIAEIPNNSCFLLRRSQNTKSPLLHIQLGPGASCRSDYWPW